MSYLTNFERNFSERTLKLISDYQGPYDATLTLNCLLGLLVVPKETMLEAIPESPLEELPKWGISLECIKNAGRPAKKNGPDTLRSLVTNLRHSVAHFRVKPISEDGEVHSFEYKNDHGLHAVIPLTEMREFVKRLSEHLSRQ